MTNRLYRGLLMKWINPFSSAEPDPNFAEKPRFKVNSISCTHIHLFLDEMESNYSVLSIETRRLESQYTAHLMKHLLVKSLIFFSRVYSAATTEQISHLTHEESYPDTSVETALHMLRKYAMAKMLFPKGTGTRFQQTVCSRPFALWAK